MIVFFRVQARSHGPGCVMFINQLVCWFSLIKEFSGLFLFVLMHNLCLGDINSYVIVEIRRGTVFCPFEVLWFRHETTLDLMVCAYWESGFGIDRAAGGN